MLTSEQLRIFLAVIRDGSTLAAARRTGVDHSTVSRRLASLETTIGARLFDRSPRGLTPTAAGLALIPDAERVESALLAAAGSVARSDAEVSGTVRLATPEIFGTYLVAPRIGTLSQQYPRLTLELAPESRSISLSKREADIAIMLRRPPQGRLVARKLTDYRLGLYAARSYLDAHGPIPTPADLVRHGFVSYIDELAAYPELVVLDAMLPGATVCFRSSSSAAQHAAVAAGAGLGMLHVFGADQDPRLVRLFADDLETRRSYWLVMHADMRRLPRVRAVVDFLDSVVRAERSTI